MIIFLRQGPSWGPSRFVSRKFFSDSEMSDSDSRRVFCLSSAGCGFFGGWFANNNNNNNNNNKSCGIHWITVMNDNSQHINLIRRIVFPCFWMARCRPRKDTTRSHESLWRASRGNPALADVICKPRSMEYFRSTDYWLSRILIDPWNLKSPLYTGCFKWMIPNRYMNMVVFTKHPFTVNCLFGVPGPVIVAHS